MSYVKWPSRRGSVHVIATLTRDGGVLTRCGKFIPPPVDELPGLTAQRSCETCLRLALRDQEASVVENDVVGDTEDDAVPG